MADDFFVKTIKKQGHEFFLSGWRRKPQEDDEEDEDDEGVDAELPSNNSGPNSVLYVPSSFSAIHFSSKSSKNTTSS
jgi:hypothetical protein